MDNAITEIQKIPKLLKENKKEEAVEIMKKYGLDVYTLIGILASSWQKRDTKRCYNCKYATQRKPGAVFCSIHQCKKPIFSTCEHFTFV